ncbi:hypothetical protein R3W88_033138 [Solanum pinnatisectum]|uniref:Uncharacterized protein n=1 Tax=Solanum pinnatisectum TaxID=50273 RepID=A0AAV9K1U3_9SOLN|nr:hypothetical protein R3W88_033138 [Solanum pinnatisectum]
MESPTIIPMILTDMFLALTKFMNGEMYFEGCNILLQIWFLEHLYHHDRVTRIQQKKKRSAYHKTVGKRVGEGQSHHCPTRSSSPKRKKSPVGVTRCGRRIEAYRREISSVRGRADSRIHLSRQIKNEQSFEISRLNRDLVASEEVVHYKKGELKRQKEKFEKERSCWMYLHDQLKAELEEHKRKISHSALRHQLEAIEERKAILNNLGDHQFWLNTCHENMGKARRQVHQLAEQTSYVIKNHNCINDLEVAKQAWAIVPHLPKVLLNLYETLGGQRKPQEDDED